MAKKKAQNGGNIYQDFFGNYLKSKAYKERLRQSGYTNPDQTIKDRLAAINTSKLKLSNQPSTAINPGEVLVNTSQGDIDEISSHEYSHKGGASKLGLYSNPNLNLNKKEIKELTDRNKWKQNPDGHLLAPHEAKADIDSLRFMMENNFIGSPDEITTPQKLKKAKENKNINNSKIFKRLNERYSEEDLIYLMNNIAQNQITDNTMAKSGKKIKAQAGTRIAAWEDYMNNQPLNIPDPLAQLKSVQNMQPKAPQIQDYGVKATDPAKDLYSKLGTYNKKKKEEPTDWSNVAASALLLTNALLPEDPIRNPVVRPQVGYSPQPQGRGSQAIYKAGGKISNTGYKKGSKDINQPNLRIPSNKITMKGVDFPVLGVSDTGDTQLMLPGAEYSFDGNFVDETPLKSGGKLSASKAKEMLKDGTAHGKKLTKKQRQYFGMVASGNAQNGAMIDPQQRAQANATAQRLAQKYGMMDSSNMQIGDTIPQFLDPQGNPAKPGLAKKLPTVLPNYVSLDDVKIEQGIAYYDDPQTGYTVEVDPSVVRNKKFQKPKDQVAYDQAGLSVAKSTQNMQVAFNFGGKMKKGKVCANGGSLTPLTDDTFQINGPSHSNGGVDLMYGRNGVEVEGGETGFQSDDGSLNIMGNMINPLTNRKFKVDSKRIAQKEQKIDKLLDYSVELVNEADMKDKWGILKFNSGKVQMEGAIKKKEELQQSKEHLSTIQQAMLDFSAENNLDPGAFSKGQFKKAKNNGTAQNGWRFEGTRTEGLDPKIKEFVNLLQKKGLTGRSGKESGVSQRNTKSGRPSRHASGEALDAFLDSPDAYNKVLKDPELTKFLVDNGLTVLNEYDPNVAKGTGATAGHLHIGYDKGTGLAEQFRKDAASLYKAQNPNWGWGTTRNPKGKTIKGAPAGDMQNFEETTAPTYFNPREPEYKVKGGPNRVGYQDYDFDINNPTPINKPSDAKGLSFTQILPELYTAATNQVEPVFMQEFTPQLYQDYDVSFQDRLNENQASFSALTRASGDNPAALATLAGQKYLADSGVLADEFRTNQAIEQDVVNKNIALLNDAELKNLGLADTQFVRQSKARSNTKQQNQIVLQSIADKIKYNELEQRTLRTYENLYPNYSFGDDYVTDFTGPSAGDAITWATNFQPLKQDAQVTVKTDAKGNVSTTKRYPSTIQQSLQNLQLSTNKLKYQDYFLNQSRRIAKNFNKKP